MRDLFHIMKTLFEAGAAGALIFSWTDQWYRGGNQITDWAFGLTDAQRRFRQSWLDAQTARVLKPVAP